MGINSDGLWFLVGQGGKNRHCSMRTQHNNMGRPSSIDVERTHVTLLRTAKIIITQRTFINYNNDNIYIYCISRTNIMRFHVSFCNLRRASRLYKTWK